MKRLLFLVVSIMVASTQLPLLAQKISISHLEPAFWWTGMKNASLQLMVHGAGISEATVTVNYPGVTLTEAAKAESPNYLFLTLQIAASAQAGKVPLVFRRGKHSFTYPYELKSKTTDVNRAQGFSAADVIYLIMPDRFANGDHSNDQVAGLKQGVERNQPFGRHGGDLKGITNRLTYLKELGITALWLNPVQENNQERESYHGYAITDFYKIDPRFGSNNDYKSLTDQAHRQGMKVIMDLVHNHCGRGHWWMNDLPMSDWIHPWPGKKWPDIRSNFRATVISDPYAAQYDRRQMADGWFDDHMPDLNQQNKRLATYLIQNTLWWIEYAGIDGIRMDTYPYPDQQFMADWTRAVKEEYPRFNIVGEVWVNSPAVTAYWLQGFKNRDGYQSYLPSVTDFPVYFAITQALNEEGGWESGMTRLYTVLSQDFLYANPAGHVIFLDNHDVNRFYHDIGKDLAKLKMALAFLLTTRGVPQLYYGTEILFDKDASSHPNVRLDFPGGWPGDPMDAFTAQGRTAEQNEAFDFIKSLATWRMGSKAIHEGKLMQFVPENNVYVYFRYTLTETVMVVLNGNKEKQTIQKDRFAERIQGFTKAKNILSGENVTLGSEIQIPAKTALVLELEQ